MKDEEKMTDRKNQKIYENRIFLLLVFFCIAFLCFWVYLAKNTTDNTAHNANEPTEKITLVSNYAELLDEKELARIDGLVTPDFVAADILDENFFLGLGNEKPDIEIVTYTGKTINLADIKGPIVLEVVADWCSYCQAESKKNLNELIEKYPDVTFIQYMQTGGKDKVETFYDAVGVAPDKRLIICFASENFNNWLNSVEFASFPTFYLFDDNKVSASVLGAIENDYFDAAYKIANSSPLYEAKAKDGSNLTEAIRKQKKARKYIEELTEIDVPESYLSED